MYKSLMYKIVVPFILVLSLLLLFSCEQNAPVSPQESGSQVTILKVYNPDPDQLHKLFKTGKVIDDDGGYIIWGDSEHGYTYLKFPEDAVADDVYIYGYWESEGFLQADFYPEGLQFNKPVYIRMSYKDANLTMLYSNQMLGIYYYNEWTGNWERVSNNINRIEQYVEGYITHFSRYAIGIE